MARWRGEALERLPGLRETIAAADNVMELWGELGVVFEAAYRAEPVDEATIAAIYSFADWCVNAPRGPEAARDPLTAVTVCFHEDIPAFELARADMPRWFRFAEVANNRQAFSYHIGDEAFEGLLRYMDENRHRYRGRGR